MDKQIYRYYRQGSTREDIFQRLCSDNNLPPASMDQISQWFKTVDDGILFCCGMDRAHFELLRKICEVLDKIQGVISKWLASNFVYFLDSRYALIMCRDKRQILYVTDNFHGQMKQLKIIGLNLALGNFCHLDVVDPEHLLIEIDEFGETAFYLMQLDLPNLMCTSLDSRYVYEECREIIFDYKNRRNFCISGIRGGSFLELCKIKGSKLVFSQSFQIDRDSSKLECARLDGNCLQAFVKDGDAYFGEYNLAAGNKIIQKIFDLEKNVEFSKLTIEGHVWHEDICYIFGYHEENVLKRRLYLFDLEQRKICQKIDYHFFETSLFENMHLEEDGNILTVCTQTNNDYFVRRVMLGKPDKLTNLALLQLRRDSMFNDDKIYDHIVTKLPQSLRPFPVCNLETESE